MAHPHPHQPAQHEDVPDIKDDPLLSESVRGFLLHLRANPSHNDDPKVVREFMEHQQTIVPVDLSGIEETVKEIPLEGLNKHLKIVVVRPEGVKGNLPAFVYFRGGGFVIGSYNTHKRWIRDLVVASGVVAVFPEFSLAPEHKYPTAVEENFAALKWVAAHGHEIGVDGSKIAVAGESAGASMAVVIALKAKENKGPHISFQALFWGGMDLKNSHYESFRRFGKDMFITLHLLNWMTDHYTGDPEHRNHVYHSPIQATEEQLRGLPPTLIQVGECDIIRDPAELFGRKLDKAGVPVTTLRYVGMIHDFGVVNALSQKGKVIPQVKSLIATTAAALRSHLF